jgi:hypothetical protein
MRRPDPSPPGPPHPDPELLALAALPAEPDDPGVAAHLHGCERCRTEVADLRRTVELAREGGVGDALAAPPARVWQGIAAELGLPDDGNGQVGGAHAAPPGRPADDPAGPTAPTAGPAADRTPPPVPLASARSGARRRRLLTPLLAAAASLVVGIGIGLAIAPEPTSAPVAGTVGRLAPVGDLDPDASGTVAMADDGGERQMVVEVQGVTDIAGGDHLEAWLMDATGTRLVPLGALAGDDGTFRGTFAVPDGLPLAEFGQVDVSAERWDGDPGHSALSLLRGRCCP